MHLPHHSSQQGGNGYKKKFHANVYLEKKKQNTSINAGKRQNNKGSENKSRGKKLPEQNLVKNTDIHLFNPPLQVLLLPSLMLCLYKHIQKSITAQKPQTPTYFSISYLGHSPYLELFSSTVLLQTKCFQSTGF